MGKPKKQKESGNERFLGEVGNTMINASRMFDPAHQSVLSEAKTDQTDLFRGRLAGDAWQQLGASLGADQLARGNAARAGQFESMAMDGLNTSLREGTRRGAELRDERIYLGAGSRLSNAKQSNLSIQQAARTAHEESSQKIKRANDFNNQLMGAGFTLASAGAQHYMNNRRPPSAGKPGEEMTLNYRPNYSLQRDPDQMVG